MKKIKFQIFIFTLILAILPVHAADVGISTLGTYVLGQITFNVTGALTTNIDVNTGALGTGLNVNYAMTTNNNISNLRVYAKVLSSTGKVNAFYSVGGTPTARTMFLVLGNLSIPPTTAEINNCRQATSTATSNANAIAYPGTITISGGRSVAYNAAGYYTFNVRRNITNNLNVSITTAAKTGTYDVNSALDEPGAYQAEIYIDQVPP